MTATATHNGHAGPLSIDEAAALATLLVSPDASAPGVTPLIRDAQVRQVYEQLQALAASATAEERAQTLYTALEPHPQRDRIVKQILKQRPTTGGDPLGILSAAKLLALQLETQRWAIPGLIAEGLVMIAGRPKMGKSWLLLSLAIAVASGGMALGATRIDSPGAVLYLALEDGKRRLQERTSQLLCGASPPEQLYFATEWPKFDNGGLDKLDDWLKQHPDCRMVIIDTFAKLAPTRQGKGNAYQDDYGDAAAVKAVADRYHVAVVCVFHTRKPMKPGQGDFLDELLGTTGLTGAADTVLVVRRERGRVDASLCLTGRDVEEKEIALAFDQQLGWQQLQGSIEEHRLRGERAEIIALFRRLKQPLSPKAIATMLGRPSANVRQLLLKLAKDDLLRADGYGNYTLQDHGQDSTPEREP